MLVPCQLADNELLPCAPSELPTPDMQSRVYDFAIKSGIREILAKTLETIVSRSVRHDKKDVTPVDGISSLHPLGIIVILNN
jgi:hypothetical protein